MAVMFVQTSTNSSNLVCISIGRTLHHTKAKIFVFIITCNMCINPTNKLLIMATFLIAITISYNWVTFPYFHSGSSFLQFCSEIIVGFLEGNYALGLFLKTVTNLQTIAQCYFGLS